MLTYTITRLFGFLLGSTAAGAGVYYYILEEYRVSNELLTEDIYVRTSIFHSSGCVAELATFSFPLSAWSSPRYVS